MGRTDEFYQALHAAEVGYGTGEYHLKSFFDSAPIRQWAARMQGRDLSMLDVGCGKGLFLLVLILLFLLPLQLVSGLVGERWGLAATGLALETERPVPLINASLNWFVCDGDRWSAQRWGDADHLDAEGVTVFADSNI